MSLPSDISSKRSSLSKKWGLPLLVGGGVLGVVALVQLRRGVPSPAEPQSAASAPLAPVETLERNLDSEEVFRRALWRRPQEGDIIHHAERREWSDAGGVTRWEWFLVVSPGATLEAWLKSNPFSLQRVEHPREGGPGGSLGVPAWFPREFSGKEIFQSNVGNFLLVKDVEGQRIYLADSGGGLARVGEP